MSISISRPLGSNPSDRAHWRFCTLATTASDLSGSTDFSIASLPDPSQTFKPNEGFTLNLQYKPSTSLRVTGILKVSYSEQLPTSSTGVTPKPILGSFSLNLTGVAPEFT